MLKVLSVIEGRNKSILKGKVLIPSRNGYFITVNQFVDDDRKMFVAMNSDKAQRSIVWVNFTSATEPCMKLTKVALLIF